MMKEIAIVTGGSSGLGFQIAKRLLQNNINVCIVSRNEDRLDNSYEELKKECNGSWLLKFCANIANEQSVIKLYKYMKNNNYSIRYLFNVAGTGKRKQCEATTMDDINEVLEANLVGLINMCSHSIKQIKQENLAVSTIINVMSSAALKGNSLESLYCASKWGARGYTESLRTELKGSNIQIIAVYPGGMKTNFWNEKVGELPDISKFMEASEVADQIVSSIVNKRTILVTDISINRL